MDTKDEIFAQNWVEQFRFERRTMRIDLSYFYPGRDVFRIRHGAYDVIDHAFSWIHTPQGRDTWESRAHNVVPHVLTR